MPQDPQNTDSSEKHQAPSGLIDAMKALVPKITWVRAPLTPEEQTAEDGKSLRAATTLGLGIAVLIGVVVAEYHGGIRTVSLAAFGSALGLGGVLGFLFGIPSPGNSKPSERVQGGGTNAAQAGAANPDPNPQAQNQAAPEGNGQGQPAALQPAAKPQTASSDPPATPRVSNLEQVADWVTKLLLGGGLTQMQRIPPLVWRWSHPIAIGILNGTKNPDPEIVVAQQAFACGLMVYGFVLGFFAGFLITKLQLGKAISD